MFGLVLTTLAKLKGYSDGLLLSHEELIFEDYGHLVLGKNLRKIFFNNNFVQKVKNSIPNMQSPNMKPALERPKSYTPTGPGEFGKEYILDNLTSTQMQEATENLTFYLFNMFISDRISVHRTLEDHRPEK